MKLGIVSGGFDPIHEGHIELIKACKAQSDGVIILLNSEDWLTRKKGYNFQSTVCRKAICENIKGVVEVIEFDDSDNSASDGLRLAREKYPNDELFFANGGDRNSGNIPEHPACVANQIDLCFGVGGEDKKNSSSWIINRANELEKNK